MSLLESSQGHQYWGYVPDMSRTCPKGGFKMAILGQLKIGQVQLSHAQEGLLHIDGTMNPNHMSPLKKLSTLVHKTPQYVLQETKINFSCP